MTLTNALGYFLLSIPFIVLSISVAKELGLMRVIIVLGIASSTIALMFFGAH